MFKKHAIKKYGKKLLPTLKKRYGEKPYYSASEVRATVYKNSFNPKYLPLAYLLCLEQQDLNNVLFSEYPELDIYQYKKDIFSYIIQKNHTKYFQNLNIQKTNL